MKSYLTILIVLLNFPNLLTSQNLHEFKGLILAENDEPISSAHIRITSNNSGIITNEDGRFLLKSKNCRISIEVSHLEHETQTLELDCNVKTPIKIILTSAINALNEVTVVALSANEIVNRAIANLEKNYQIDDALTYTIFSRLVELEAKKPIILKEFVFDMIQNKNNKADFKILKIRGKGFSKEGEDLLKNSRLIDVHKNETHIMLRFVPDFLEKNKMKRYNYVFKGSISANNSEYYIIEFSSNADIKEGIMHIDKDDYGISYLKRLYQDENYRVESYRNRQVESHFIKENDKWFFSYGSGNFDVCQNKSKRCISNTEVTSVLSKTNGSTIGKKEEMGNMAQNLLTFASDFNDTYWDSFNYLPLPDWLKNDAYE
jgi:hypothetical protein